MGTCHLCWLGIFSEYFMGLMKVDILGVSHMLTRHLEGKWMKYYVIQYTMYRVEIELLGSIVFCNTYPDIFYVHSSLMSNFFCPYKKM